MRTGMGWLSVLVLCGMAYGVQAGQAPVANAGADQTVSADANCMATVTVDGSASTDADNDALTFLWTGPFSEGMGTANTAVATVTLPLGTHELTLKVTDATGLFATDTVTVTVNDTTPPVITASASPNKLWPPNHKMVPVTLTASATDNCMEEGEVLSVKIVSVESDEPENGKGDGNTAPDYEITGDLTLNLRAERAGPGDGRVYTITLESTDHAGNTGTSTVTVTVPHDMGDDDDDEDEREDGLQPGMFRTHTQSAWGGPLDLGGVAAVYLSENFSTAFPLGLKVGALPAGLSGSTATFDSAAAIEAYLPASGAPAIFAKDHLNPLTTEAGELAGQAVALTLNVEFDLKDSSFGSSKTLLRDLVVDEEAHPAYGLTVGEVLAAANAYLGGGSTLLDGPTLVSTLQRINENFEGGTSVGDFLRPVGATLDEDECKEAGKAVRSKSGKLHDKLVKLFDRDGDKELKGKELSRAKKAVREGKKFHKDRAKAKAKAEKQKGKK